jgi:hypothetical protein
LVGDHGAGQPYRPSRCRKFFETVVRSPLSPKEVIIESLHFSLLMRLPITISEGNTVSPSSIGGYLQVAPCKQKDKGFSRFSIRNFSRFYVLSIARSGICEATGLSSSAVFADAISIASISHHFPTTTDHETAQGHARTPPRVDTSPRAQITHMNR